MERGTEAPEGDERSDRHPRRRHGADLLRVLLAGLVLGLSTIPLRRDAVGRGETGAFDLVNALPDAIYPVVWAVMQLGAVVAVPVIAAVAWATGRRHAAVDLAAAGVGAWVLAKLVKAAVARPRPGGLLDLVVTRGIEATGMGFASGHTAVAFAMATAAAPHLGRTPRRIGFALAALVGLSRIYVGAHLPLDVVGGAALGWGFAAAVHLALGRPTGRPERARIVEALGESGWDVERLEPLDLPARASAPYRAWLRDGTTRFVKLVTEEVGDRDVLARLWRWLAYRGHRLDQRYADPRVQVRHEAMVSLAAQRAGVRTPALEGIADVDASAGLLVFAFIDGSPLSRSSVPESRLREQVARLHGAAIAHGRLTPDDVLVDAAGDVWIVDFGLAHLSASTEQLEADRRDLFDRAGPTDGSYSRSP